MAVETYYRRQTDGSVAISPPAAAMAWARDAGLQVAVPELGNGQLRIVDPQPGSVFYMAPELRAQELSLRASAPASATTVTFRMNGQELGEVSPGDARLVWALQPGQHEFQVTARLRDGSMTVATSTFEVKPR
jgi:hypothetical protein